MRFGRARTVDVEPESVSAAIIRLEQLTERIEATAAALERVVAKLRAEEEADRLAEHEDGAHTHDG